MPKSSDAVNEFVFLQRYLHANDVALCEEYTFGTERFYLPFPFCQKESPFAQRRSSPSTLDTATFCVCVLAAGMRFRETHGIAASPGISHFCLAV